MATAQIAPVTMALEIPGGASCSAVRVAQRAIRDAVMISTNSDRNFAHFAPQMTCPEAPDAGSHCRDAQLSCWIAALNISLPLVTSAD